MTRSSASPAVVDRVNTTLEVWMGLTMGCAQCHSHKYDPISQDEYYQFFAFFNQTADSDKDNEQPTLSTPDPGAKGQPRGNRFADRPGRKAPRNQPHRACRLGKPIGRAGARDLLANPSPRELVFGRACSRRPISIWPRRRLRDRLRPRARVDLTATYRGGALAWTEHPDWTDGKIQTLPGERCIHYLYRTVEARHRRTDRPWSWGPPMASPSSERGPGPREDEERDIQPGADQVRRRSQGRQERTASEGFAQSQHAASVRLRYPD